MIPGANVLNMTFRVIAKQTIVYFEAEGRSLNNIGQDITNYAAPVNIKGSFQPVARKLYEQLGLDFQKNYFNFFTSNDLIDITRDVSGDQIYFQGQRYQCESATEWFGLDGWVAMLCVQVQDVVTDQAVWGFNSVTTYPDYLNDNTNFENGNFARGAS